MTYSVTVANNSGAPQNVAIFLADTFGKCCFSLFSPVWLRSTINDKGNHQFKWDDTAYGLGWGNATKSIDVGAQFQCGQMTSAFPFTAKGENSLPIGYQNGSFYSGRPYFDNHLMGKLRINTDRSFTVSDALTMGVALYIDSNAALVAQGAPNTQYIFNIVQFSYYLIVTKCALGTVLPQSDGQGRTSAPTLELDSMTPATRVDFGPGATSLKYDLNGTLDFQKT
ncbi:hypothetical protein [Paraburkholderia youngii]|uniref:hypothetical protein n=1 Tax=Paraburkholderia youngii TaxID=2782701 RepID=UPI001C3C80BC|nr:hypothetical protein [Paraburkholderia youngii]